MPSSAFLWGKSKKVSYFVDSKSTCCLGGYFLGLPLPLLICPSNLSGCFVFIWLFKAGWLKNDLPQSQTKSLPCCSCFDLLCLSIKIINII